MELFGSRRVLEPSERIAEVLFGLIMVLTFTGSLSVAEAGRDDVRTMLIGALGCNFAWGVIDGVLYLMGALAERGRNLGIFRAVRAASDPAQAHALIADTMPPAVASLLQPDDLERLRTGLRAMPEPSGQARLVADDWRGAVGVFLLVFLSTLPVAIPFIVMTQARSALRVSNAIAVGMLLVAGVGYGRLVGGTTWKFGAGMVVLGGVLVALTMAFGG